jgi:hypothetical protein
LCSLWLKPQTDRTTATQNLSLMKSAVDDIVLLEYMQQNDHSENTYKKGSLTYLHALKARNPICSNHKSMAPDCKYKIVTDGPNVIIHATDSNWCVSKHHSGNTLKEERKSALLDPDPVYVSSFKKGQLT